MLRFLRLPLPVSKALPFSQIVFFMKLFLILSESEHSVFLLGILQHISNVSPKAFITELFYTPNNLRGHCL